MREHEAFAELLRRHEELTQRFARLLHDDAGQILTSIALQLSVLEGAPPAETRTLIETLDELLERFRLAQSNLGAAVIPRRGLLAALSQLARMRPDFRVDGDQAPAWPVESSQAAFRIVEALAPKRAIVDAKGLQLEGAAALSAYERTLAAIGNLSIHEEPQAITIGIYYANSGLNR